MNDLLILFLSMSFSGSLLMLALFLLRPLYQKNTSRRWQYYVWLIVIARLLLPFSPEKSLTGLLAQRAGQIVLKSPAAQILEDDLEKQLEQAVEGSGFADPKEYSAGQKDHTRQENLPAADESSSAGNQNRHPAQNQSPDRASVIQTAAEQLSDFGAKLFPHLGTVWIGIAMLLGIRKITAYQDFLRLVKAGREEITDTERLDQLAQVGEHVGVMRPVELYVNRLVSSPMLLGLFRPCIVLPTAHGLSNKEFIYTIWHELIHYKHLDLFYKWLVQITVCLHWFNPLVRLMGRELERACELACDETVIRELDERGRRDYGNTLLHAFETGGSYKNTLTSVMLSEGAEQLKERLGAIMIYKRSSKLTVLLSISLTITFLSGAAAVGAAVPAKAFPKQTQLPAPVTDAAVSDSDDNTKNPESENSILTAKTSNGTASKQAKTAYQNKNLAVFGEAFSKLDASDQKAWLKKIYKDGETACFSISIRQLDRNSPLLDTFAKTAYEDNRTGFFAVIANEFMDRKTLKSWLEKSEKDKRNHFQKILMGALGMDTELDEKCRAEYEKHGITIKGESYYYQGKLVHVFLDFLNKSFYTLALNPKGTVNVKVTRDADGNIQSAKQISDAQARKLLEKRTDNFPGWTKELDEWEELNEWDQLDELDQLDALDELDALDQLDKWEEPDQLEQTDPLWDDLTKAGGVKITVPVHIKKIKDGDFIWLGTYNLDENDKIFYHVTAKTGKRLDVGFAKPGNENPSTTYHTVSNHRTDGKLKVKSAGIWKKPLTSGKYNLFIHTRGSDLSKVTGTIVIVKAKKA